MKKSEKSSTTTPKWARGLTVYMLSLVAIVLVIFGVFSVAFANEIYPRVAVNGVVLGGLKQDAAKEKLATALKDQPMRPVILTSEQNDSFTIKPDEVEAKYDIDKTVAQAYAVGRGPIFLTNLSQKILSPLLGIELPASVSVNDEKFGSAVAAITNKVTVNEKNADISFKGGVVAVVPEVIGKSVDNDKLKQLILDTLGSGSEDRLEIKTKSKEPVVKAESLGDLQQSAEQTIREPILFTYKDQKFTASPEVIGSWLTTKVEKGVIGSHLELTINDDAINSYLNQIGSKIETEPINARLAVVNGIVTITEQSKDGLKLDRASAKTEMLKIIADRQSGLPTTPSIDPSAAVTAATSPTAPVVTATPTATSEIALKVDVKKPDVTNTNISEIGIKERVAVSTTEFKGSPANRQENIRIGTRLFNGIVLKPGEQFSAVKSLGRIDESAGFKPELVIKEDQLVPEVGGGLCQVSTTLFRAALNAGLQIDERRNHRFRVSYYEARPSNPDPDDYVTRNAKSLVGLDATIYDPSPDFKFTNDTNSYMLIQGRVEGTKVTFELFGTKDGRTVSIDGPYITSTTPAPTEIKYIDEPNLPLGEIKAKEKAVAGAKTSATYTVMKEGKQLHKNTFTSSYTSWQAKSYRGTGPAAAPSPTATPVASPTPEASPATTPAP